MTTKKEASTVFWYRLIGHQPRCPIERGELQNVPAPSPGIANDNQLAWPPIPFPEDWWST
jgi:hypothetical protein